MSENNNEKKCWVFQSGKRGILFDEFRNEGFVTVGEWKEMGDLMKISRPITRVKLRQSFERCYPNAHGSVSGTVARALHGLIAEVSVGDHAVVYGTQSREFLLGKITGEYEFVENSNTPHRRKVEWKTVIPRDNLPSGARIIDLGLLGLVPEQFAPDLFRFVDGSPESKSRDQIESFDDSASPYDSQNREEAAREAIKDRIVGLTPNQMEYLAAAVLRAMGYKTKVSLPGPDGGIDVVASFDHFGLERPRTLVQVKHRPTTKMSVPEIRAFMGVLGDDRGLFVSTGGFSEEARRETRSSDKRLALLDLDDLADLVIEHYDNFDPEGRALLPLVKMYWPI